MKKLIVSGDSVSDLEFRSSSHPEMDTSWRKWPEYIAEYLDMELVCLARGGMGNDFVYSTLLDEITKTPKDEIGLVIAGWSQGQRRDWQNTTADGNHKYSWRSLGFDKHAPPEGQTRKSLRNYQSLQILCERYDLPYIQFQTGHLFEDYYRAHNQNYNKPGKKVYISDEYHNFAKELDSVERCLSIILSFENIIDTSRFIGWPISENIGGFSIQNKVLGHTLKETLEKKLVISEADGHPNAEGQKAIAEFLKGFI
jgi:hypothetical protein|tara:strand:- start:2142 stop:2906 length:765 start_codon:yes stop_codon:yes gene_type:complete